MIDNLKHIIKYATLLLVGGVIYCIIELLFRGHTHWTMFIVGGLCFIFCGLINKIFPWDMPMWQQMLICSIGITIIEFISGVIINIIFKLHVWDYSNMPLNILGQVCVPFTLLWFLISGLAIVLDDYLRYWWFDEEKPRYKWF